MFKDAKKKSPTLAARKYKANTRSAVQETQEDSTHTNTACFGHQYWRNMGHLEDWENAVDDLQDKYADTNTKEYYAGEVWVLGAARVYISCPCDYHCIAWAKPCFLNVLNPFRSQPSTLQPFSTFFSLPLSSRSVPFTSFSQPKPGYGRSALQIALAIERRSACSLWVSGKSQPLTRSQ